MNYFHGVIAMPRDKATATVTIGIPFFNAAEYLHSAILSVFAQTYGDWRLLLVNDGSTDRSLEVARSFEIDSRVTVISERGNLGLASRLNQITHLADTPYIARMDADDLMAPTRIQKQLSLLQRKPGVDLTATGLISMGDSCEYLGSRISNWQTSTTFEFLTQKSGIVHASVLGKTEWFKRNPYREGFDRAEDVELWVRSNECGDLSIAFLPEPLYFYREFDSTSIHKSADSISSLKRIAKIYPMKTSETLRFRTRISFTELISLLSRLKSFRTYRQRRRNARSNDTRFKTQFSKDLALIQEVERQWFSR